MGADVARDAPTSAGVARAPRTGSGVGSAITRTIAWVVLVILSLVLATGMSWSHIRRRMSGQFDVDEKDD